MSFASQSELPQHLSALAALTQWHANTSGKPLEVHFDVTGGSIGPVECLVAGSYTEVAPAEYVRGATVAAYELAQGGHFDGSYSVRVTAVPGGQAIVKQMPHLPTTEEEQAEPEPTEPTTAVSNDGLQLRAALLARGHNSGYTADEVAAEEKQRGITYTPELKFYRALVRNGVVAERGNHNVVASAVGADFGASSIDSVPWRAPQTTDGAVQSVLNHNLWIEIANDPDYLYAIDLAPGTNGVQGQVIARRRNEASVPVRVAMSLVQFVAGEFTDGPEGGIPSPTQQTPDADLTKTIAWAGQVEPEALPSFLGWALPPTSNHLTKVLRAIGQQAESSSPDTSTTPQVASSQGGKPAHTEAPNSHTDEADGTTQDQEKPPVAEEAQQSHEKKQGEPASTFGSVTSLFATASEPDTQDDDLDDVDPGVAKVPSSPEQKNIADSIATLAFGTPEERDKYRDTDTASMPSIASRVKKVTLADIPEKPPTPVRQKPQEEGGIRAVLRKFFIG